MSDLFERVELLPESLQIMKNEFTGKDRYYWLKPVQTVTIECVYDLWVCKNIETEKNISILKERYNLIPKFDWENTYVLGPFELNIKSENLIDFMFLFQRLDFREKEFFFRITEDGNNIIVVEVDMQLI